jgi:hypothetical protein
MKNNNVKRLWVIAFCIAVFIIICIHGIYSGRKLRMNLCMTCGQVTDVFNGAHSTMMVKYNFTVKGQNFKHSRAIPDGVSPTNTYSEHFLNKYFPVAYDSTNVNNCLIVLIPDQIESLHLRKEDWNRCADSISQIR